MDIWAKTSSSVCQSLSELRVDGRLLIYFNLILSKKVGKAGLEEENWLLILIPRKNHLSPESTSQPSIPYETCTFKKLTNSSVVVYCGQCALPFFALHMDVIQSPSDPKMMSFVYKLEAQISRQKLGLDGWLDGQDQSQPESEEERGIWKKMGFWSNGTFFRQLGFQNNGPSGQWHDTHEHTMGLSEVVNAEYHFNQAWMPKIQKQVWWAEAHKTHLDSGRVTSYSYG